MAQKQMQMKEYLYPSPCLSSSHKKSFYERLSNTNLTGMGSTTWNSHNELSLYLELLKVFKRLAS